jgi:uncharacterized coiled-coil protein SlyX
MLQTHKGSDPMLKKAAFLSLLLIVAVFATSCTPASDDAIIKELEDKISDQEMKIAQLEQQLDDLSGEPAETPEPEPEPEEPQGPVQGASLLSTSLEVLDLLKDMDMAGLSNFVHSTQGLRFTPYDYVDTQSDLLFTAAQVAGLAQDNTVYLWGSFDGSGNPISQNYAIYHQSFVYDQDFLNPHIVGINNKIGTGNMINNVDTAYPNGQFVEFHFTGFDPQYEGMDWKSLKLVFEDDGGMWYLVGIIHGQWTI